MYDKNDPEFIQFIEDLEKGETISEEDLCKILDHKTIDDAFKLKALAFRAEIEKRRERIGKPVTVRFIRNAIHVCTDAEASDHNATWANNYVRRVRRCCKRIQNVDPLALSAGERASWEHRVVSIGRMVSAIGKARREVGPEPVPERPAAMVPKKRTSLFARKAVAK